MRPFSVFNAKGSWYKGNCHTHTHLSDGGDDSAETAKAYRLKGYDFLVITDHRVAQPDVAPLQRKDYVVIPGAELHPPSKIEGAPAHHLVAIGLERVPARAKQDKMTMKGLIAWVERNGGIPVFAHPYWSGHDIRHMEEGRTAFGVETYNSVCQTTRGLGDASVHLDQALSLGFRWKVFGVDDTHRVERDAFGGWIMVKAPNLSRAALMKAILKGHFYASSGPELKSVSIKRNVLRVECSPVRKITLHGRCSSGRTIISPRKRITEAEFDIEALRGGSPYLRIEITDTSGGKAWSNPVYWDDKAKRWGD